MTNDKHANFSSATAGFFAALFCTAAWIGGGLTVIAISGGAI